MMSLTDIVRVTRPPPDRSRRDASAPWRHVDSLLVAATLALGLLGVVVVYSATRGPEAPHDLSFATRQAAFVAAGVVAMLLVATFDYRRIRDWAALPYAACVLLLIGVLTPLGVFVSGATRWIALGPVQLQPSEFAKVALVVAIGALLSAWDGDVGVTRLGMCLAVAAVPVGLIVVQPDLGTVLQFLAVTMVLLLLGGVRGSHLVLLAVAGLAAAAFVLTSETLADYQAARLTSFIDPAADVQGSYNQGQSITAVASGGVGGQGLFSGSQTQLSFVPEQHTDFIFTVVAEELGFVGSAVLLGLYAAVSWRIWRAAQLARDRFGTLLCGGVLAILVFQVFANVGMATGIMPVTGIPLPFLSFGGSAAITMFIAIGLVLNVHMRRFRSL